MKKKGSKMVTNIASASQQAYTNPLPNKMQTKQVSQESFFKTQTSNDGDKVSFKKDGLSTGTKITIAAGIGTLVASGIYLVKSGKGKQAIEAVKKFFAENNQVKDKADDAANAVKNQLKEFTDDAGNAVKNQLKEFTDDAGNAVKNVKLEKGEALLENGRGFTGTLKTATKTGKNVEMKYLEGKLQSSSIDGKLFKEYAEVDKGIDGGVKAVIEYGKDGKSRKFSAFENYRNAFEDKVFKTNELTGDLSKVIKAGTLTDGNIEEQTLKIVDTLDDPNFVKNFKSVSKTYVQDKHKMGNFELISKDVIDGKSLKAYSLNIENLGVETPGKMQEITL